MDSWGLGLLIEQFARLQIDRWFAREVLTLSWWYLTIIFFTSWLIWFRLVDTKRMKEIVLIGLMSAIITTFLDDLGSEINLWQYPIKFIPVSLLALPFDFCIIPVTYMLVYQYFGSWRSYLIAILVMSFVFAFIGEPISSWLNCVRYVRWNYSYSFLFYILNGIVIKAATQKINKVSID